jgi:phosphoribosyl-ATP pyrophosphohydrolase
LVLEDPEKLFSKLAEEAEEVLVPSETPEPSEEITAH